MRHELLSIGHKADSGDRDVKNKSAKYGDFVLEKTIFNNIFEKDIRRVFMYKKAERLAKALCLIAPAFTESSSLRCRIDEIAIGLIDAAILPVSAARDALSRHLLTLSSILSMARTTGLLSPMNAELISRETHFLLQEVAAYEEPQISFDEAPTLSNIAKVALKQETILHSAESKRIDSTHAVRGEQSSRDKGHIKDTARLSGNRIKDRQEAVMSVIRNKGSVSIKDISGMIRGVSEKTIQRELLALIEQGIVLKRGERRWSTYSLA